MTDNLRYVGDVFIDGKTDILLREFLTNLFDQYNGEGKGFNADMLDGHHYADIEYALNMLEDTKLSEITIGGSVFNADNPGAYLHFSDVVYEGLAIEWMSNYNAVNYNITNAMSDLYGYILDKLALKVDEEKVDPNDNSDNPRMKVLSDNNFSDQYKSNLDDLSGLLNDFVDYTDANNVTHHFLSADLTNGLRFILITQSDYDNLSTEFKNYWRNVFIIKESVPTALDYQSPLNFPLEDGYDFRVAQDDESISDFIVVDDDGSGRDYWIQIKHTWDDTWTNLMPIQNFLLGVDIRGEIVDVLENNPNVNYNKTAIKNIITQLLTNFSDADYVPLSYLPSSYKNQFVHQISKNGSALTGTQTNGFVDVDIGNVFDTEFDNLDDKINAISNTEKTGTLDVQINELNTLFNGLNTQINGNNASAILKRLDSINQSIGLIQDDISAIKGVTTKLNEWKSYTVPNIGVNWYNETLKIAYFVFDFRHYFNTEDAPQSDRSDSNYYAPQKNTRLDNYTYTMLKAKPVRAINVNNNTHPFDSRLLLTNAGEIMVMIYNKSNKPGNKHFGGFVGLYRYSGLYTDAELEMMKNEN